MTTITRSRHTLNVPVFVGTVVTLVLLAPVLYAWRNFQAQRTADSFLDYATQAEEAQDFRKASSYLQRYLVLKPDTAEAWVRLAETYDKSAVSARDQKRAVSLYFRALGMAEQQDIPRLRQRLGQLLLNEQRFADVRAEAQALIDGNEASGWRLMAFALFGQFQSGALAVNRGDPQAITVGEAAQKAVDHDPRDIEMSGLLARVYRDHPELLSEQQTVGLTSASRAEKADAVMNAVVAANDQNATALLARFQYRDFYGQADARQDLNQALEIGPDDPAVLLVAAEHARKTGDSLRQINLFSSRVLSPNDATAESPGTPTDTQTLDIPEAARQAYDEARKHYEHLLEVGRRGNLNLEQAYAGLGDVFFAEGDIDQAIQIWRKGLQVGAGDVNFALKARLAEAFVRQNNMAEADTALAALDSAFNTIAPSLPRSTKLANQQVIDLIRAQRYVRDRQFATAIPLLRRVTSSGVEDKNQAASNQYLQSLWLLANVYAAIGQWDQSAAVYQQVATLRPNEVVAQEATANSWMSASRPDLAVPYFQRALSLRNSPSLWLDLALAEFQQQVRAPMGQRNWEAFQHALTQAEQRDENGNLYLADPWRAVLLRADFENAQAALPTTGNPLGDREAGIARALERYRAAEAEYPQAAEMFRRLAFIYEELGQSQDADRALSAFAQLANDEVAVCLVRAGLLAKRQQYDAARTDLENTIRSTSDKNSQARLQSALAQVLVEQGAFGEAEKSIRKVHDLSTGRTTLNVRTLQQLADLAWEARDLEKLAELESQLQGREGASGSNWRYYRAQRLLHESQDINDSQFREAVELATWLLGQRPAWSPVHVLLANIEQRRGGIPQAIGHYQNAIRLGSNQLSVYERLVYLLSVSNRFAEAEDYLSRLQRFDSSSLDALEISIAARQGQTSRAVELARRHLQRNTNDVMAYIWLGQMLTLDGQIEAAETELKKATTYVPDDARTWLALFGFYVRTQQVELAEKSLQSLIANVALGDLDRTFLLAQGYELLKQDSTAEAYYIQSQKLAPDNPKVLSRLGGFYLSRDANKAIDILERLMRVAPQSDAERRSLAALLAKRGKANDFARALELLETTGQATDGNAVDQRLQAIFLSRRGGLNNIKKAQTILQNLLLHATTPVDSDRVLLARSYLLEREYLPADDVNRDRTLRLAQEQYVSLAARSQPEVVYLTELIEFLLANDVFVADDWRQEASLWLPKLEELVAGNGTDPAKLIAYATYLVQFHFDQQADEVLQRVGKLLADQTAPSVGVMTAYVDLQLGRLGGNSSAELDGLIQKLASENATVQSVLLHARWLKSQGKTAEAETLAENFARTRLQETTAFDERTKLLGELGELYSKLEMHSQAERWYRQLVSLNPDDYPRLAQCLAQAGQIDAAIKVCSDMAAADDSPRPYVALATALVSGNPSSTDIETSERFLNVGMSRHGQDIEMVLAMAHVRFLQNRTEEAAQLYQEVLKLKPTHLVALNNLAMLMAEKPGNTEKALQYVNEAIQLAGRPTPLLLDTKGMVLFHSGQADQAVDPLRAAATSADTNPIYTFHLAAVLYHMGDRSGAEKAYKSAVDTLPSQTLTPSDRKLLSTLKEQFGSSDSNQPAP